MIDEKNPLQEFDEADDSDDEVIIDLTDEVVTKTEDDEDDLRLPEDMVADADKSVVDNNAFGFEEVEDEDRKAPEEFDLDAPNEDNIAVMEKAQDEPDEDHIVIMDNARNEPDEALGPPADVGAETAHRDEAASDLEAEGEIEYERDEFEDEFIEIDDERTDDDQDFFNIVLGQSEEVKQKNRADNPGEYFGFEPEETEDKVAMNMNQDAKTETFASSEEEPLKFENNEDAPDLEAEDDLEGDDEVIPLDGFSDYAATKAGDIAEISEFDPHLRADAETLLKPSGIIGAAGADGKNYLELIDVEEDSLSADVTDEPGEATLAVDRPATEPPGQEDGHRRRDMAELTAIAPEQIDAAVERIINEKFSAKIEDIIYEVIEKAVAKEIDRLKGALMGDHRLDDD